MKSENRILWLVLFLAPVSGELLSGNCPPLQFFNPLTLLTLVLFYGGGTLLIREARARWNLQWPVLLLAVAYAIWEEGTSLQTFFNSNDGALGMLAGYGMYGGVQWPWAIDMTFYHATTSTLVPLTIVDLLWPEYRHVPLLRKRGIALAFVGMILARFALVGYMLSQEEKQLHPYQPDPLLVIGSLGVVGLLIACAYLLRRSAVVTHQIPLLPPFAFAALGFFSQAANLIVPVWMAAEKLPPPVTLAVQLTGMTGALAFVFCQLCHRDLTMRHIVSLIFGSALFYLVVTPGHEFVQKATPKPGMVAVGVLSLVFLIDWSRRVLRAQEKSESNEN